MAWRSFSAGVMAAYLTFGTFFAFGMARIIPAMNGAGVAYYVALWPAFFASGAYGTPAPPIPRWCFTFRAKATGGES